MIAGMTVTALPESLADIRDEFLELPESDRLQLLLEFSRELPPVPARYDGHPELCERVAECQSPVYIVMDVDAEGIVSMHAMAPAEAPTTRGFASILVQGLTGLTADEVLAVPADFPQSIGLTRAVSPLRLAGMTGMLMRAKRQVAAKRGS
jgi:cysteine desulfuration protein SufE